MMRQRRNRIRHYRYRATLEFDGGVKVAATFRARSLLDASRKVIKDNRGVLIVHGLRRAR